MAWFMCTYLTFLDTHSSVISKLETKLWIYGFYFSQIILQINSSLIKEHAFAPIAMW